MVRLFELKNKLNFFKNTKKDIIMTQKDDQHFRKIDIFAFLKKNYKF